MGKEVEIAAGRSIYYLVPLQLRPSSQGQQPRDNTGLEVVWAGGGVEQGARVLRKRPGQGKMRAQEGGAREEAARVILVVCPPISWAPLARLLIVVRSFLPRVGKQILLLVHRAPFSPLEPQKLKAISVLL